MVNIVFEKGFTRFVKSQSKANKNQIHKLVRKIITNPLIGKPMRYQRKVTRELYVKPFRISYKYTAKLITLLDIYHKNKQ